MLTWNQHGRRLNRERLERQGSGYVARHEPDQFLAGDEWFRGIDIREGPDGALYGLDWSDTGECHDHTGVHRTSGRIYRFSYGDTKEVPTNSSFGRQKFNHNGTASPWGRRQVRKLLDRSADRLASLPIEFFDGEEPLKKLRMLWMALVLNFIWILVHVMMMIIENSQNYQGMQFYFVQINIVKEVIYQN